MSDTNGDVVVKFIGIVLISAYILLYAVFKIIKDVFPHVSLNTLLSPSTVTPSITVSQDYSQGVKNCEVNSQSFFEESPYEGKKNIEKGILVKLFDAKEALDKYNDPKQIQLYKFDENRHPQFAMISYQSKLRKTSGGREILMTVLDELEKEFQNLQ